MGGVRNLPLGQPLLDAHLDDLSVADTATTLGVSTRTLQRKLGGAETTFQSEMTDARVRAAKSRLLDGDAALTTIAIEVGFASLQSFTASFRRRTGETPGDWRRRKRGGVALRHRPLSKLLRVAVGELRKIGRRHRGT